MWCISWLVWSGATGRGQQQGQMVVVNCVLLGSQHIVSQRFVPSRVSGQHRYTGEATKISRNINKTPQSPRFWCCIRLRHFECIRGPERQVIEPLAKQNNSPVLWVEYGWALNDDLLNHATSVRVVHHAVAVALAGGSLRVRKGVLGSELRVWDQGLAKKTFEAASKIWLHLVFYTTPSWGVKYR